VSGQAEGLAHLPDSQFLPPMELSCAEVSVRDAMHKSWGRNRLLTIGRTATLTAPHNGRSPCHYCGPCHRGCSTFSYFSSLSATLPAAAQTGRMTLQPNSVVERVLYDETTDRATGVRVIDADTMQTTEYHARVIFLCASTLESTRLLLNSPTPRFSAGLANSSGVLGKHLMDHVFGAGASGTLPGMERQHVTGRRPNGIYVPRFRNVSTNPNDRRSEFVRGYAFQGGGSQSGWQRGTATPGFGAAFKASLSVPGPWEMSLGGFGECLPRADNAVTLHPTLKDKWGVPSLSIRCTRGPNEDALLKDMQQTAAEILEVAGATGIEMHDSHLPPGLCIHEMGTARMGRDAKTSVLNKWNQAHDVPNLFVTDGACMTSSACQNPSLTYMALTARACHYAVQQLQQHVL
jgi:choline dehydrogenase-like flavoprotein